MSAIKIADNYISEFEYLEGEKISEIRHEYIDGEVFAMAGSSVQHNRIAMNIANFIYNEADAKGGNCEVFTSDIKVGIKSRKSFYYPDVILSCDDTDDEDPYYKNNPCIIFEVLSDSTQEKDRIEKLLAYQTISSLQSYIMVAQDRASVIVVSKNDDGEWFATTYTNNDESIHLPCLDAELSLSQIYKRVNF
jgi:Uma2 family endonuclease